MFAILGGASIGPPPPPATPPTISTYSPSAGKAAGGTAVSVVGTHFVAGMTSTLGAVSAITATTCTITTTSGSGAFAWTLTTTAGTSTSRTFSYLAAPVVSAITPNNGSATGATAVAITCTNLPPAGSGLTPSAVVGGVACTGITWNASTNALFCTVPAGSSSGNVVVTVDGVASTGGTGLWTAVAPPTIVSQNVDFISAAGGIASSLILTGTGFTGAQGVTIDGVACTIVSNTGTVLTLTPPASAVSPTQGNGAASAVTVTGVDGGTASVGVWYVPGAYLGAWTAQNSAATAGVVTSSPDMSGNANPVTPTATGPGLVANGGANGMTPYWSYASSADFRLHSATFGAQANGEIEYVVAAQANGLTGSNEVLCGLGGSVSNLFSGVSTYTIYQFNGSIQNGIPNTDLNDFFICSLFNNSTTSQQILNGMTTSTGNNPGGTSSSPGFFIGGLPSGGGGGWLGRIYQVFAYPPAALNATGRANLAAYFSWRGIYAPSMWPSYFWEYAPQSLVNGSGTVATWMDIGPTGNNLTASGSAKPAYVASAIAGLPGATFVAATPNQMSTASNFTPGNALFTAYTVLDWTGTAQPSIVWETTANALANNGFLLATDGGSLAKPYSAATGGDIVSVSGSYGIITTLFDNIGTITGASVSMWQGPHLMGQQPQNGVATNYAASELFMGARSGPTLPESMTISHLLGYNANHSTATVQSNIAFLEAKYGLAPSPALNRVLFAIGDSLSSAYLQPTPWTSQIVFGVSKLPHTLLTNTSWPGKTLAGAYAQRALDLAFVPSGYSAEGAIVFLGTNDAAASTTLTPAALYATLTSEVAYLLANGLSWVGVTTMIPRGGGFSGGVTSTTFETFRQTYNTLVRNGAVANGYTVIDWGGDPTIGDPANLTNTSVFLVDEVHLTASSQVLGYTTYTEPAMVAAGFT